MDKNRKIFFHMKLARILVVAGVLVTVMILLFQMFYHTNRVRQKTYDTNKALIEAQNVAEQIKSNVSVAEAASTMSMTACNTLGTVYCMYYDQHWKPVQEPSHHILIVRSAITRGTNGRMVNANVSVYREASMEKAEKADPLVSLDVEKYVSGN